MATIFGLKVFFFNVLNQWLPVLQEKTKIRELIHNLYNVTK